MTVDYGTILDGKFLPQGLALYRSFERHVPRGRFYFFAVDDEAVRLLGRLMLARARIVTPQAIARPELEAQRAWRTFPEYCWASKPLAIRHMLAEGGEGDWACYLDSDMAFFADPEPLIARDDAIGLFTPHRFSPAFAHFESRVGHHNGGFGAFRCGPDSDRVLERWFQECLARPDRERRNNETFDQKIFDRLVAEEPGVKSLTAVGINLAPWNFDTAVVSQMGGRPTAGGEPLYVYHFQSLRMHSRRLYTLYNSKKPIPAVLRRTVYAPYLRLLRAALGDLSRADPAYVPQTYRLAPDWKSRARVLFEALTGARTIAAGGRK